MAMALACAAPALADETIAGSLAPGGTISTGTVVSPTDPVQMTVTAPAGGSFTLTKITRPSSRAHFAYFDGVFVGPQLQVTYLPPPGCTLNGGCVGQEAGQAYNQQAHQKLDVSFLVDKSIMPRSGDATAEFPYRYAAAWVCLTNLGGYPPQPESQCDSAGMFGTPDARGQDLPDGNAFVHEPVSNDVLLLAGGDSATFDIGHQEWRVSKSAGLGRSKVSSGVHVGIQCLLACTQDITVSVSPTVARKLHISGTEIGHKVVKPGVDGWDIYVALRPAFKQAMQRYRRVVVKIHAVVTGEHGERWTSTWQQTVAGGSALS